MKGYKAFNKDLTCRGMQYEVGKTFEMEEEPICCKQGFHFCENIADVYRYYDTSDDTRICEVEAIGEIVTDDNIKYCTNKIKIVREITDDYIKKCNINKTSTGYFNSGKYNSGNCNSGDYNSGKYNSGNYNSGKYNSGKYNSGKYNSGWYNSGNYNSGWYNSGDYNSGKYNSGNYNSGKYNSGWYNSGDYNSGCFNTEKKPKIKMFDKESNWTFDDWYNSEAKRIISNCPHKHLVFISGKMSEEEKERHPEYKTIGGYLKVIEVTKEDKQKWWDNLSQEDKEECFNLPNFDTDKFCECLGIEHI